MPQSAAEPARSRDPLGDSGAWRAELGTGWVVDPPPNSMVIIRAAADWRDDQVHRVAMQIRKATGRDVIVLAPDLDMSVLPEDAMRRLGWCRCPEADS